MKILVTGDREWDDIEMIADVLSEFPADTILVHGAARGADRISGVVGEALNFVVRPYPADWDTHHRAAGPIRNQLMLTKEHLSGEPIDEAHAFHDDLKNSKGTADMVRRLKKAGITVKVHAHDR